MYLALSPAFGKPARYVRRSAVSGMAAFTRILVGYDGSFEAQAALELAVALARENNSVKLTAVAVARLPRAPATVGEVREERAVAEDLARQWLDAAAAYASECGCHIDTRVLLGRVAPALIRAATERSADLLVIGSAHRQPAWLRLRPNTTTTVVRHASCPVLVARR
jgi:nucleotide-binding universal stress UspA family protein